MSHPEPPAEGFVPAAPPTPTVPPTVPPTGPPSGPPSGPPVGPPVGPPRVVVTTIPTKQGLLRACVAPLLGYAITVVASLVVMALVVAAVAVGSDGVGDADPTSDLDVEALGTLIGMPFQLAAMAMGGSLRLGGGAFSVSLFAPPLLLTAVLVAATSRLARRAETSTPTGSTVERVVLAAFGAVVTAVVAVVATRLLAMRSDGDVLHAASVGLFLGTLTLTFLGALLGRLSAHGSLWPRWLPTEGRRAAHLVTQHVVAYVVVVIPLAAIWLMVGTSVESGLIALVFGPTLGLHAFGLGHLGATTALGEHAFAWDLGWFPGVVLPLLAVVLAVTAACGWHLRRGGDRALLAQPASWVALPVAYGLGALVVCLASTVGLSGALYGAGGGLTVTSAYWLIPVLAVWGAAVETLSRFLAPQLTAAMGTGLRRRLATGPAHPFPAPAPPVHRVPLSPADRARARSGLIWTGLVAGLALVGFTVVGAVGSAMFSPESEAEAYLDALVDGDAARAVDLAPVGDEAASDLLTDDVYRGAESRITGYEVTDVEDYGDTVVVTVDLEGVEEGDDVELTLSSQGSRAVFFDDWQVDDGGLASLVSVPLPDGATSLVANDVSVPVEDDSVDLWALPGTYTFDPYGDSQWVGSAGSATTVAPGSYGTYVDLADPEPTQALRDAVDTEVTTLLERCMVSTEPDPDGCPQQLYASDDIRGLTWTLDQAPTVSWDGFYGSFPVGLYSDGEGRATATYEYDASYGFGTPDWTEETQETTFYLGVTVDLVDDEPQVTLDD